MADTPTTGLKARAISCVGFALTFIPYLWVALVIRFIRRPGIALVALGVYYRPCTVCRRPVDIREPSEGGDAYGSQLRNGRWVCSSDCWEKATRD